MTRKRTSFASLHRSIQAGRRRNQKSAMQKFQKQLLQEASLREDIFDVDLVEKTGKDLHEVRFHLDELSRGDFIKLTKSSTHDGDAWQVDSLTPRGHMVLRGQISLDDKATTGRSAAVQTNIGKLSIHGGNNQVGGSGNTQTLSRQRQEVIMSEDHSTHIQAGRDASGNAIASQVSGVMAGGDISGTINQLKAVDTPEASQLAESLVQLKAVIEDEPSLDPEDQTLALEQVKALAEAGQNPKEGAMQKLARRSVTTLRGIMAGLPEATKLAENLNKLLPIIAGMFELG